MPRTNYIYSDSLETMVLKDFFYKGHKWIWNDEDCVYYREDTDECYLFTVPNSVIVGGGVHHE